MYLKKIMHNVYIKLYTICPQNVDNFLFLKMCIHDIVTRVCVTIQNAVDWHIFKVFGTFAI